MTLYCAWSDNR